MITHYKTKEEFHITISDILVPVRKNSIFVLNLTTGKFDTHRDITLGGWDEKTMNMLGSIITIDSEFIKKNSRFFDIVKPIIFSSKEVIQFIKDIKEDIGGKHNHYFFDVRSSEEIYQNFVGKNTQITD